MKRPFWELRRDHTTSSHPWPCRHKARALRFRLLRRRLEAACGQLLTASLDGGEAGCLSPLSDASLCTPSTCPPGSAGKWRQLQPVGSVVLGVPVQSPAAPQETPAMRLGRRLEADAAAPEATVGDGPLAEASPALGMHSNLADHLSDATPSSTRTSLLGAAAAEGAAAVGGGSLRLRLSAGMSSCGTLSEVPCS